MDANTEHLVDASETEEQKRWLSRYGPYRTPEAQMLVLIEGMCPVCNTRLQECENPNCSRGVCPGHLSHSETALLPRGHKASHFWTFDGIAYGCCQCGALSSTGDPILWTFIPQRVPALPETEHVHEEPHSASDQG